MSVEVIDEYQMQLKQTFAILVSTVTEKLEAVDTSVEKIRHHVIHTFPPGNVVSNCKSIGEIFAELSRHKLWNFSTELPRSTFIKGLAETFIKDDPELRKLIDNYRFQLTGFKAMTNIALYIKKCKDNSIANSEQSIQSDIALYDEDYYSELSTKLNARVTERSLLCIDDFWKSIADHFLIPSLSSVLKSIEMGCVEVTWYVPTLSALHIQTKIQSSTKFFQEQKISRVTISSEVLYDEGMSKVRLLLPLFSQLSQGCIQCRKILMMSSSKQSKD